MCLLWGSSVAGPKFDQLAAVPKEGAHGLRWRRGTGEADILAENTSNPKVAPKSCSANFLAEMGQVFTNVGHALRGQT